MSDEPTRPIDPSDDHTRSLDDTLPDFDDLPDLPPGTQIGRYTIQSVLGAGGMGAVYKATQQSPHRTVALKLMKHGAVSPRALRRFELESEVLGKLTHPGIAQIHEAGMHNGAPFFAMEYVPGQILTDYAQSHNLSTHQRLELFAKICNAVHHAHTKGVIHRDLKPHNILVTEQGEPPQPQPKILDFGVARATDSDVQSATIRTDVGQLIGTIPYMSPEQVAADPSDIDTRSDVYALGVVLYELLAGRMPYDIERKLIHEAARVIREDEPTRLSSINTTLRGDVETIVAKALEKERDRRYQSALDLGSDINRYLHDEPIAARPPSTWYQLRKFSKRNKALVTGTAAAFAFLLLGLVGTTYGLIEANTQRERVEQANTTLRAQNNNARSAIEELLVVSGVFDQYNLAPGQTTSAFIESEDESTPNHYFTLRGADDGSIIIDPDESHQSNTRINDTFAAALPALALEYTKQALERERARIDELEQVTEFQSTQLSEIDPPTMGLKLREGLLEKFRARDEQAGYDEEEIQQRLTELDESLNGVDFTGMALESLEENIFSRAIEAIDTQFADQPLVQAQLLQAVAGTMFALGLTDLAEKPQSRALNLRRTLLGDTHPDTIESLDAFGGIHQRQGRYAVAEEIYAEALNSCRSTLGDSHPLTRAVASNLASSLVNQGRFDEAEPLYREMLDYCQRVLAPDHDETIAAISNMGYLLMYQGKLSEAEPYCLEAVNLCRSKYGDDHLHTLYVIGIMGNLLDYQRKFEEAEPYKREAVETSRRLLGNDHLTTFKYIGEYGSILGALGRYDQAEPYLREALETSRRVLGDEHPNTLIYVNNMGYFYFRRLGKPDLAEPFYREAMETSRRVLGADHPNTIIFIGNMAGLLRSQGKFAQSEAYYLEELEISRRVFGTDHPDTLRCLRVLIQLNNEWHESDPTANHDQTAADYQTQLDEILANQEAQPNP